jgi:porin
MRAHLLVLVLLGVAARPAYGQTTNASNAPMQAAAATTDADRIGADADADAGSQERAQAADYLTGDWGVWRSELERRGVKLTLGYKNETAGNLSGGTTRTATSVGQVDLGVALDLKAILGWDGATVQSTITFRHGPSLNTVAGLNFLEEPQETFGRGQTWRWTELWFRQRLIDDHVIIKVGRLAGGEFANWGCDFTNLGFCGSQVGTTNTYFWYNWPIAEWGGSVKIRTDRYYVHIGANEDNARNLNTDFFVAQTKGARGVIEHLEAGWTPAFAGGRLAGVYQAGVWRDSAAHPDVLFDTRGAPAPLSGGPAAEVNEQTGFYVDFQQQLTGEAHLDRVTGILTPTRGLTVGAYYERGDQRTATTGDEITVEALYTAPFADRPHDQIGVALGRSTVTSREAELSALELPQLGRQYSEYRSEIFYRVLATRGVFIRPNFQYIIDPGGYSRRHDASIIGVRLDISF